jgi:hypothetical protein
MYVSEEQMTDAAAMRPYQLGESGTLLERDAVHHVYADFERGVMHEEINGPVRWRLGEGTPSPGKAAFAQLPSMARLIKRVEEEQPAARRVPPALYEAVHVPGGGGEDVKARGAPVMVADQDDIGNAKTPHALEKAAIGVHLPPVRQITGDDRKLRIGVVTIDVGNGRIEPDLGVETIKLLARSDQVGIGDVDELHAQSSPQSFGVLNDVWRARGLATV